MTPADQVQQAAGTTPTTKKGRKAQQAAQNP